MLLIIQLKGMVALKSFFAIKVVGRLEQRIKDLETQFDEEQRRLVDAERWFLTTSLFFFVLFFFNVTLYLYFQRSQRH